MSVEREVDVVASRLVRAEGMRYSSRRRAVVVVLAEAPGPMTAVEVAEMGRLPESSTYRVLDELLTVGVVTVVAPAVGSSRRFELSEAVTSRHHHHAICAACGFVLDVEADAELEQAIEAFVRGFARRTGFEVGSHDLDLRGRCSRCRFGAGGPPERP